MRELSVRKADAAVCDVEHVVEPLEEGHAVDEVEPGAGWGADVRDDEVDVAWRPTDGGVELQKCALEKVADKEEKGGGRTARGQIWALGVNSNECCGKAGSVCDGISCTMAVYVRRQC